MHRISLALAGSALIGLASCTTAPPTPEGGQSQMRLAQMLAGKTAGTPTECIPDYHASAPSLIAPDAIAFSVNPGLTYVTSTAGTGCAGLADPTYSLAVSSHGPSGLCHGDLVQVRDLRTGMMVGGCSLGEFVPYHKS